MTLTGSGQISFNDIRIELNVPSQSPFTLDSASNNKYANIQNCLSPFPSPTNPDAITEWYGYNHSATASLTINETTDYTSSNCTDACNGPEVGNTSLQAYTRDSSNYYGNTICTTGVTAGFYAVLPRSTGCYTVVGSPASITLAACGSTTTSTTTTTTTACLSFAYAVVTSLTDCNAGSWPNTGYQNTGFGVGAKLNSTSNCRTAITDTYIQTNDGTNYQLSSGIIQSSNNPGC